MKTYWIYIKDIATGDSIVAGVYEDAAIAGAQYYKLQEVAAVRGSLIQVSIMEKGS